jgi:hypothetical protein
VTEGGRHGALRILCASAPCQARRTACPRVRRAPKPLRSCARFHESTVARRRRGGRATTPVLTGARRAEMRALTPASKGMSRLPWTRGPTRACRSCAGVQCVPKEPSGWSDPLLLWIGPPDQVPECPASAPNPGGEGYVPDGGAARLRGMHLRRAGHVVHDACSMGRRGHGHVPCRGVRAAHVVRRAGWVGWNLHRGECHPCRSGVRRRTLRAIP